MFFLYFLYSACNMYILDHSSCWRVHAWLYRTCGVCMLKYSTRGVCMLKYSTRGVCVLKYSTCGVCVLEHRTRSVCTLESKHPVAEQFHPRESLLTFLSINFFRNSPKSEFLFSWYEAVDLSLLTARLLSLCLLQEFFFLSLSMCYVFSRKLL